MPPMRMLAAGKSVATPRSKRNGIPAHRCVVPKATSSVAPVGRSTIASPKVCAKFRIMPS